MNGRSTDVCTHTCRSLQVPQIMTYNLQPCLLQLDCTQSQNLQQEQAKQTHLRHMGAGASLVSQSKVNLHCGTAPFTNSSLAQLVQQCSIILKPHLARP